MVDEKDKKAEYIALEQPQGVPDVKPISKKELDEKIGYNKAQKGSGHWRKYYTSLLFKGDEQI